MNLPKIFMRFMLFGFLIWANNVVASTHLKPPKIALQRNVGFGGQTREFPNKIAEALGFKNIPVGFLGHGTQQIPILIKKNSPTPVVHYYLPPPMTFVPNSASLTSNPFTSKLQISFSIKVADRAIENKAKQLISKATGRTVAVETIGFSELRLLNKTKLVDGINPKPIWISNQNYHETIRFMLLCDSDDICPSLHQKINENPWTIKYNFQVETKSSTIASPVAQAIWDIKSAKSVNPENLTLQWKPTPPPPTTTTSTTTITTTTTAPCLGLPMYNGWCLFQFKNKTANPVTQRSWLDYRNGFGNYPGNFFWGGLEKIRQLTSTGRKLRVEWSSSHPSNGNGYVEYNGFYLGPESTRYRFQVGTNISGTAGDIFPEKCSGGGNDGAWSKWNTRNKPFCTYDNNRIVSIGNECLPTNSGGIAVHHYGTGWWICKGGFHTNLNFQDNRIYYCENSHSRKDIFPDVVKMMIK